MNDLAVRRHNIHSNDVLACPAPVLAFSPSQLPISSIGRYMFIGYGERVSFVRLRERTDIAIPAHTTTQQKTTNANVWAMPGWEDAFASKQVIN
jgi:hypothetical protein